MLGVSCGFHRLFTHRSFRASRAVRIGLAPAGAMAIQGPILRWAADHRRHHAFADRDGEAHSPWRYGTGPLALAKGMVYAHMGWFYDRQETNLELFVPDLLKDRDVRAIDRLSGVLAVISITLPTVIEVACGVPPPSRVAAALFWAGLVRIFFVHHVCWSVNSICHTFGDRPFTAHDQSANCWALALLSMGDAWHNSHHAMPGLARQGVKRGQIDLSAFFIAPLERLGWASHVKRPTPQILSRRAVSTK
jgi:stearoyl-CoA desaturase (Delta-9 desaturase)